MRAKGRGKISYALQAINIIPLLFFGVIILLSGSHWFSRALYSEVKTELSNVAGSLAAMLDSVYPGDYRLSEGEPPQLYKGDYNISGKDGLLDRIKQETGLEITLFYQDVRMLTTITDDSGSRAVGSGAPDTVVRDVLLTGKPRFYSRTTLYHSGYFAYYTPLFNSDGSVAGMLFAGKPTAEVDTSIHHIIYPLIAMDIILVVITSVFTFFYTRKFVSALLQIHGFLGEVSTGNLNASLSPSVLKRRDELGEIADSALNMQRSLHNLIEQDALTSLANRRSGDRQLRQIMKASAASGSDFCVAIGDIDFFKRVNDTYGHDCGDFVLKNISSRMLYYMQGRGTAARWGGEEFLLVFENMNLEKAHQLLQEILNDIRSLESEYNGHAVKVTMTFGLTPGNTSDINALLRSADEKLYAGKATGRNCIMV